MNDLAFTLAGVALQVSLVSGLALLLDSWLVKRCPRSAARLLTAAALLPVPLTLAAFCPAPEWWAVRSNIETPTPPSQSHSVVDEPAPVPEAGGVFWLSNLRLPNVPATRPSVSSAAQVVSWIWFAGIGASLGALALGLLQVSRLRRRSCRIEDPALFAMARSLAAELGVRRHVELREAALPGLPATFGWWRPMILLPIRRHDWSADDCRAVLAHELAHIRHGDYQFGVLTLLARAVHFYHPLLRGLIARLRLRQELAADGLAAPAAGGRDLYVRALARLALRSEGRPTERPAQLLLAARGGAVFRRIQMLRSREVVRPLSRRAGWSLLALLVAVAALASSLRSPAQTGPTPAKPAAPATVEPFDLSYLSSDGAAPTHGVFAFRPNVLFAQPGMETVRKRFRDLLSASLEKDKRALPDGISLDDVEQIVGDLHLQSDGTGKPGSRSLMVGMSSIMVRMRKDMDWDKTLKALFPEMKVAERGGRKYYEIAMNFVGPMPMVFCAPDKRTLVMVGGIGPKEKLPELHTGGTPCDFGPGWKQVERSAIAIAIDNRDGHFVKKFAADVKEVPSVKKLLEDSTFVAVGIEFHDGVGGKLHLDGKDMTAARAGFVATCDLAKKELAASSGKKQTADEKAWIGMLQEILTGGTATVNGTQLTASGHSKVKVAELFGSIFVAQQRTEE